MSVDDLKALLDTVSTERVKLAPAQDWSRCRVVKMPEGTLSPIKEHVKIGVRALLANPYLLLADEMGGMKTAQVIIAAQFMFLAGIIDRVIVIAPASVRDVWFDKELGELSLHLFDKDVPARVSEFHTKIRQWDWGDWTGKSTQLRWIITNYEFAARSKPRLKQLKAYCGAKTLLVLDESSAVKNKTAQQSKACLELRRVCGRVVELNGTPIPDTPIDLMNQANLLNLSILECPYITMFRHRYCELNPKSDFPQIIGWKNLDDLQRRLAPYVLRRLKEHCLDLPPKLPPVVINVALKDEWPHYKTMRDDMVAWVASNHASLAGQAVTKAMRLAQITSGFLGGIEEIFEQPEYEELPDFMKEEEWALGDLEGSRDAAGSESSAGGSVYGPDVSKLPRTLKSVQEIGRAKLEALLHFYEEHLDQDKAFKLVVWCRFKPELERLMAAVQAKFPHVRTASLVGNQKKLDRQLALRLLHPRTAVMDEPALLGGTYGTGSMGHNFTAAHVVVNMSYDYSLFKYQQGSDRNHRPGQTKPVSYYDLVATGPAGQKTIDHQILRIRRDKADIAQWTSQAWVDALTAE